MPSFERESQRIVIAGASSLLGAELKSLLQESLFAAYDFRLVDEELAAGTLTEAGRQKGRNSPGGETSFRKSGRSMCPGLRPVSKHHHTEAKPSRRDAF